MCDNSITRGRFRGLSPFPLSLCLLATFHIVNINLGIVNHEHDGAVAKKNPTQTKEGIMNGSKEQHYEIEIQVIIIIPTHLYTNV